MPSAVSIFLKMADEKQVNYFTWPYPEILLLYAVMILYRYKLVNV